MNRRRAVALLMLMTGALVGACGMWLHVQKRQYVRNRQLIEALVHDDTKQALTLVNTGADPNTRLAPAPAPTFRLLLDYLLYPKHQPVNDSATAFMLACGGGWHDAENGTTQIVPPTEDLLLLQVMLASQASKSRHREVSIPYAAHGGIQKR